jgi:primosomal protein N'
MVNRLAMQWCQSAQSIDQTLEVLGPSPSFIGRVRKNHRAQVLLKVSPAQSHRAVRDLIRRTNMALGSPPKHYRIAVDVDPVGLA